MKPRYREVHDLDERCDATPPPWRAEAQANGRWCVLDARGQRVAEGMPEWLARGLVHLAPRRS